MSGLKVLETNIIRAGDVIFWLDGTSAESPADMLRIADTLLLQLTKGPRDLQVVHGRGKTALMRRRDGEIIDGVASEADKQAQGTSTFVLSGVVSDPERRYIPRRFSIDAGNGAGHGLVIYPSPLGTRFGPAGGLTGMLRFNGSKAPLPWALLTLAVTTAVGATLLFRCQTAASGDFLLPMNRLPRLPEGITGYTAELSVKAHPLASAAVPLDPSDLVDMDLGDLEAADTFSGTISLTVVPGTIRSIRSADRDHLAVQPQ